MPSSPFAPPAQIGDCFLLLFPDESAQPGILAVQTALQTQLGGKIYSPVHLTLQRFAPPIAEHIAALRDLLNQYPPFDLYAIGWQPVYSSQRQTWILKIVAEARPSVAALTQELYCTLQANHLSPQYRPDRFFITALRDLPPAAAPIADVVPLTPPRPFFRPTLARITQITGQEQYRTLAEWVRNPVSSQKIP